MRSCSTSSRRSRTSPAPSGRMRSTSSFGSFCLRSCSSAARSCSPASSSLSWRVSRISLRQRIGLLGDGFQIDRRPGIDRHFLHPDIAETAGERANLSDERVRFRNSVRCAPHVPLKVSRAATRQSPAGFCACSSAACARPRRSSLETVPVALDRAAIPADYVERPGAPR